MIRYRTAAAIVFPVLALTGWWSLPAQADAPPCRYETTSDTVFDRTTKLTWQRSLDLTVRTHEGALTYCKQLELADGGWRLPTVKELQTLLDLTRSNPAADTMAFPNVPPQSSRHWSSTSYAKDEVKAWFVQFSDGTVYWEETSDEKVMYVRCVR